jgi:hypothetical protein
MTNCTSTCENGLFWVQNITLKNIEVFAICLTPLGIECQRHESLKPGWLSFDKIPRNYGWLCCSFKCHSHWTQNILLVACFPTKWPKCLK